MTDTAPDLHATARVAVAALAADPGIPSHLTTNPSGALMWHIDHGFLDALPSTDRPRIVWVAMTALTGHGLGWTHPDIDTAHRILDAGGVLVLVWDTEEEPDPDADYDDEYDDEGGEEWTPGTCDHCGTRNTPPESREPFTPVCACSVGEGAPAHECVCT